MVKTAPALKLLRDVPLPRLALLLALMLALALTEGAGILALVPMLALLGKSAGDLPSWAAPFADLVTLPAMLGFFVALVAGRAVIQYALTVTEQRTQFLLIDRWRTAIFAAIVRADWRTLAGLRRSDQVALMVQSVDRLGNGFLYLLALVSRAVTLGLIWIVALWLAPELALAAVVGGLVVVAGFVPLKRRAHALGEALSERYRQVQATLDDTLRALRLIKSHGREEATIAAMDTGMADLREAQLDFERASGRSRVALQAGAALLLAAIIALAAARGVSTAVLLPLIVLFGRSVPLLEQLQLSTQRWAHAAPALAEAERLLATVGANAEPLRPGVPAPRPRSTIALDAATLDHGRDRPAVDRVTLTLPVATTTALVGPSGAGKSTIADLFGGLIAPDAGRLAVDGAPLTDEVRIAWRGAVAYVHQEPVLFPASIRDNLLWSEPDAADPRLERALRDAAAQFVFALPEGLDTMVGDAGCRLSGGERQRIALARALLRDPDLLILDEATSALDPASEAAIAQALSAMQGTRTILIVAHRGMLTDLADHVVHLRDGRIERVEDRQRVRA
ncbi:ABC transporter ATP-binding protein [Croceicoccus sp. BE223]|uniref:ABC transporter ATP-binding protein n=1 Tax=Croceicoccus sp. BE223 TaxID=2817716 RepID=UPI002855081C|nr:ABC transporter ATP-binding protein [Croceicoccus sp. BE223]MDR7100877.1 ATP-binding cassette subfamily C protein [Croceicoccus sp. BE223]